MSDLYRLIEQVSNINNQISTLQNKVVYKDDLKNILDELSITMQSKLDNLYKKTIEDSTNITKKEINLVLEPLHSSLKAEFKICLDTAISKLGLD